ncbi:MAG: hypothetical protein IJ689_00355 [Alphaproteobacteria bacterium]|nr:hypothetical protein [Alphaproteobacteria bacterium]
MNKYILLTAVAGVVLGSYAAYAANSDTMNVSVTVTHDVSLTVTHNLNMGSITVNPGADWSQGGVIEFATDGSGMSSKTGNITSYSGFSIGTFTANVLDWCKVDGIAFNADSGIDHPCFRAPNIQLGNTIMERPYIIYDSDNKFKFQYNSISWDNTAIPQSGEFGQNIVIEYIQ